MRERSQYFPYWISIKGKFEPWKEALEGYFPIITGDYSSEPGYRQKKVIQEGSDFMWTEFWDSGARITRLENAGIDGVEISIKRGTRIIEAAIERFTFDKKEKLTLKSKGVEPDASYTTFIQKTRELPPCDINQTLESS